MTALRRYEGRCHCGRVTVALDSAKSPAEFAVRACQCSFCRRQGARCVSDPDGQATIEVADPAHLRRYRFGLQTADFLLCDTCGSYLGALMTEGEAAWVTLNINCFDRPAEFGTDALPVDYEAENEDERRARRRSKWTPAHIEII